LTAHFFFAEIIHIMKNIQLMLIVVSVIFFVQCRRPPGTSRPPVPTGVMIFSPTQNIRKVNTALQDIDYIESLDVITSNSSGNIVPYPGGQISVERKSTASNPTIQFGNETILNQPRGATNFGIIADILTQGCGWPIPGTNYDSTKGGKIGFRHATQIRAFPFYFTITPNDFYATYRIPCN
jgi:hypothetical protein